MDSRIRLKKESILETIESDWKPIFFDPGCSISRSIEATNFRADMQALWEAGNRMQDRFDIVNQENEDLRRDQLNTEVITASLRAEIENIGLKLSQSNRERMIAALEKSDLIGKVDGMSSVISELKAKTDGLKDQNESLGTEVADLRTKCKESHEENNELRIKRQLLLERLFETKRKLHDKIAALAVSEKISEELQRDIAVSKEGFKAQVDSLNGTHKKAIDKFTEQCYNLQKEAETERRALTVKAAKVEATLTAKIAAITFENEKHKADIETLNEKHISVEVSLEALRQRSQSLESIARDMVLDAKIHHTVIQAIFQISPSLKHYSYSRLCLLSGIRVFNRMKEAEKDRENMEQDPPADDESEAAWEKLRMKHTGLPLDLEAIEKAHEQTLRRFEMMHKGLEEAAGAEESVETEGGATFGIVSVAEGPSDSERGGEGPKRKKSEESDPCGSSSDDEPLKKKQKKKKQQKKKGYFEDNSSDEEPLAKKQKRKLPAKVTPLITEEETKLSPNVTEESPGITTSTPFSVLSRTISVTPKHDEHTLSDNKTVDSPKKSIPVPKPNHRPKTLPSLPPLTQESKKPSSELARKRLDLQKHPVKHKALMILTQKKHITANTCSSGISVNAKTKAFFNGFRYSSPSQG